MNRRKFLKLCAGGAVGGVAAVTLGHGIYETEMLAVRHLQIHLPHLPAPFAGTKIAFLSDFHHSQVVPRSYLEKVVATANSHDADYIVLGGDYVTAGWKYPLFHGNRYIKPCFEILAKLRARAGRFAVTGNHDTAAGLGEINSAMAAAGIENLSNRGVWLERNGTRLRLCGVGDLMTQSHNLPAALGDASTRDAVILVTHNPDYAEHLNDPRVGLMLSGHTHGGQVVLPFVGAPVNPVRYGQKYLYGLVQAPHTQVYVTRGIGVLPIPIRVNCPPEIAVLTLWLNKL